MSLVRTLARVAIGIAIAKVSKKVLGGGAKQGGGLLGGLLGGSSAGRTAASAGGLAGLGGLLGGLLGQNAQASQPTQNTNTTGGGMLGGLFDLLGGGSNNQAPTSNTGNLGSLFKTALDDKEPANITAQDEKNAEILLRAMINAVKADGKIDAEEQRKITEHMQGASNEELLFVSNELSRPLDLPELINSVPRGLEQQVYVMSLLACGMDNQAEIDYLRQLAHGLNLANTQVNQIHQQLDMPAI